MSTTNLSDITKASELLEVSYDILKEKRSNTKQMGMIAGDVAKSQKIEKPVMLRCKDYSYYRGRGWLIGNPLELDPQEKFKDRVSPTFKKLLQIIDDLYAIGQEHMLDAYFDAMKANGVEINVTGKTQRVNDKDETWAAIENMSGFQVNICNLADELNFGATEVAENIDFCPKKEFKGVLSLYEKKTDEKDSVDDTYQNKVTELEMTSTAYTNVYDENL
jgi:hypothetical protein